jgi:hypothetical protein
MQHAGRQQDGNLAQQLRFSQYGGRTLNVADNMDLTRRDAEESGSVRKEWFCLITDFLRPKKNDVLGFKIYPKKNDILLNLACVHVHVGMQQSIST